MKTRITELFNVKYPIIQGGMQWISRAELAAAVSNAGALGTINATTFAAKEGLRDEIRKMRSLTDKPFAVNISMLPELVLNHVSQGFIETVIEEKVPIVETSGRSPKDFLSDFKANGIKTMHKAASVRHALKAQELGVDAVAIVGYECGGHPGMDDVTSLILWPKAADTLKIPVVGGGGICDAKSFFAAIALGLEGVIIGTRFMVSRESPIHEEIKKLVLKMEETETVLTQRSIKNALRVYNNQAAQSTLAMEARGATLEELLKQISGQRTRKALENGDLTDAQIITGQVAGRIQDIKPVAEIIQEIIDGADMILKSMGRVMSGK